MELNAIVNFLHFPQMYVFRLFFISHDGVKPGFEAPLKHPLCASYSTAGDLLVVTTGPSIRLYEPWSATWLHTFNAHLGPVEHLVFSPNDHLLFSCGVDGCVYASEPVVGGGRAMEWEDIRLDRIIQLLVVILNLNFEYINL